MTTYKYKCLDCGKTYIGPKLEGEVLCNCEPPHKLVGKVVEGPVVLGTVAISGAAEILGRSAILAAAVINAIADPTRGRTAPNNRVNHLHIGGNANNNLMFDNVTGTILGTISFHMEKGMSAAEQQAVTKVCNRITGPTQAITIRGDDIS